MAPFIPVPGVVQMEARFTLNGAQVENVLYYQSTTKNLEVEGTAVGDLYIATIWGAIALRAAQALSLNELKFTDLDTQFSPTFSYLTPFPLIGNVLTDAVPNGSALVVCLRTNGRGRISRGRNYIAGIAEGNKTNSVYNTATVNAIQTGYQDFIDGMAARNSFAVVVSRTVNKVPRLEGLAQEITTADVVTAAVRSQRRRNVGIGV